MFCFQAVASPPCSASSTPSTLCAPSVSSNSTRARSKSKTTNPTATAVSKSFSGRPQIQQTCRQLLALLCISLIFSISFFKIYNFIFWWYMCIFQNRAYAHVSLLLFSQLPPQGFCNPGHARSTKICLNFDRWFSLKSVSLLSALFGTLLILIRLI